MESADSPSSRGEEGKIAAMKNVAFVIITRPGARSGRSSSRTASRDMGLLLIDNLPVDLLAIMELTADTGGEVGVRVAAVIDMREARSFPAVPQSSGPLAAQPRLPVPRGLRDEVLARRFSETRRPHPLAGSGPLVEALKHERATLARIRGLADDIIDTSRFNIHELRDFIRHKLARPGRPGPGHLNQVVQPSRCHRLGPPVQRALPAQSLLRR